MRERNLIRHAAQRALLNKTRAANNVDSNRVNPLSQRPSAHGGREELPIIVIYTRSTKSSVFDESPRRYKHEAELVVECALEIQKGQEIDDELDNFEQEAITAMLLDDSLEGTTDDLVLVGSENTFSGAGEMLLGAVIITFQATYYTYAPAEDDQSLDDLSSVHTQYSLEGKQGDPQDRAKTNIEGLSE